MRQLLVLLLAITTVAAEGAPLGDLSVPDAPRLRAHLAASIYGQLWSDPAFAPLREHFETRLVEHLERRKIDFAGWYSALRSGGLVAYTPAAGAFEPPMLVVADLGDRAADAFACWRADGGSDVQVPGADAAFRDDSTTPSLVTRRGSVIASTSDGSPIPAWRPTPGLADLGLRLDGLAIGDLLATASTRERGLVWAVLAAQGMAAAWGHLNCDLTLVPEGVQARIVSDAAATWLVPIDRVALDRVPINALSALAIGIDGAKLWTTIRQPVLRLAANALGSSLDEAEVALNANLSSVGIETGLAGLIGGINGTLTLAQAPAAPFPSLTLSIPRSAGIDRLIALAAAQLGGDLPGEGGSSMLPFPGAPLMITLARDTGRWLVTSDPALAVSWLEGRPSGWAATPVAKVALAKGGADAVVIGASDTPTLIRTLVPFVALGLGQWTIEPEVKQAILRSLGRLAELTKTGYVSGRNRREGGTEIEAGGALIGALIPLMALSLQ